MSDPGLTVETGLKVLEIISIIGGGALVMFRMGRVTERVETLIAQQGTEITALKSSILAMGEVVTRVAVQNNRLDNQGDRMTTIERHIDELRRGEGLIAKFPAGERTR